MLKQIMLCANYESPTRHTFLSTQRLRNFGRAKRVQLPFFCHSPWESASAAVVAFLSVIPSGNLLLPLLLLPGRSGLQPGHQAQPQRGL
jgi:hypothetical protein